MNERTKQKELPFYLILLGIFLILTAPTLFTQSMFMDGIYYASIARNLAEGIGTFWHPEFTKTHLSTFHEHPPLGIGLQSLFFRLFGDAFWVERLYSFLLYLLSAYLLVSIWKRFTFRAYPGLDWLPLLFGITIPLFWWGASNNVLENTMMPFILSSVLFFVKSLWKKTSMNVILGGSMIALAVLCKGPVGLFPLSFFFWIFCCTPSMGFGRMLRNTALALSATALPILLLFCFSDPAYLALKDYLLHEVLEGISQRETVDSRFFIVKRLFDQLIPCLLILGISFPIFRRQRIKGDLRKDPSLRWGAMFGALGLSGVLPMMISKTQGGFYLIPALPFFSIAFAFLLAPYLRAWLGDRWPDQWGKKVLWGSAFLLLASGIGLHSYFFGKMGEDREKVLLAKELGKRTQAAMIGIPPSLNGDFGLHAYIQRYARSSLDPNGPKEHRFFIRSRNGNEGQKAPKGYERVRLGIPGHLLYRKKE